MRTDRLFGRYMLLALSLLILPAIAGCNTMEGALMGAGLGAGTGALAGGLSRHAGAGTAIGAGAGALIGGIMGYQAEQAEKQRQAAAYPPGYPAGGTGPYPAANQAYSSSPGYYPQQYQPQPYNPQSSVAPGQVMPAEPPRSYDMTQTATPITTVVNCPHCGQSLDVSDFKKGSKVRCPACNSSFYY